MTYDLDLFPQDLPIGWVPGTGKRMGAMIVGEVPNQMNHKLVERYVREAGAEPEDIYITFLVKANIPTVGEKEIEASLPYLKEEIQFTVPRYILALGETVYQTLTGSVLGLELYRGLWQRLDEQFDWDEAVVMPTFAPEVFAPHKMKQAQRDVTEFVKAWKESFDG